MRMLSLLVAGVAMTIAIHGAVKGDDFGQGAAYSGQLYSFEGLYAGVIGGGGWETGGFKGTAGAVVGVNFAITSGIIASLELQATGNFGTAPATYDALALARLGGFVSENAMVYAAGGAGIVQGRAGYAVGGGIELALSDNWRVRGEVQGLGQFGAAPSGVRAVAGVVFQFR